MQHNPVAIAVESLQEQWTKESGSCGDFKILRWLIKPDEKALINGFLQLESSAHGQCDDFFVVLFTPFVCEDGLYSSALVNDMFAMWDNDNSVKQTAKKWDRTAFLSRIEGGEQTDKLLVDVLWDFKKNFCKNDQRLVLGLLAGTIDDVSLYNDWIVNIAMTLPNDIALVLMDFISNENFKKAADVLGSVFKTLKCGRFDMNQIASDLLAAQPNPESPQVVFQQCLLKMGKATNDKSITSLTNWGNQAIKAAQQSGSQSFLATAYLVYGGFMMQFKNKETLNLLNKGAALAKMAYDSKQEAQATTVLMQIYGYYSAYYSIMGKRKLACEWSFKQAEFASQNDMKVYAISIYRHTAQLAISSDRVMYEQALSKVYEVSAGMSDDELRASEIQIIAYHYVDYLYETEQRDLATEVESRMCGLIGEDWQQNVPSLKDKHAQIGLNLNTQGGEAHDVSE